MPFGHLVLDERRLTSEDVPKSVNHGTVEAVSVAMDGSGAGSAQPPREQWRFIRKLAPPRRNRGIRKNKGGLLQRPGYAVLPKTCFEFNEEFYYAAKSHLIKGFVVAR